MLLALAPLAGCVHYGSNPNCYVDPFTAYCKVPHTKDETVVPGIGYLPPLLAPAGNLGAAVLGGAEIERGLQKGR